MRKHSFSAWVLPGLIATFLIIEPRWGAGSALAGSCPQAAAAAAYVCCDGAGGFAVCAGRPGGSRVLWTAVEAHENDHLSWFREHASAACEGKRTGSCEFEMTVRQRNELECRGYRVERQALAKAMAGASAQDVGKIMTRRRTLELEGRRRFGCGIAADAPGQEPRAVSVGGGAMLER